MNIVIYSYIKWKWTDKIPNRVVLQQAEEERYPVAKIKERQKTWVGHVLKSENLLQKIIEGKIQGKPTRGRKGIEMLSGLIGNEYYASLKRKAQDRNKWINWIMKNEGQESAH